VSARRVIGLAALALAAGCQGVPEREIPERAIALRWWDTDAAQRRSEYIGESSPGTQSPRLAGVARVDDFVVYLQQLLGAAAEGEDSLESAFPGRLGLLDPRAEAVEMVPGAAAGALPRARSPDGARLIYSQVSGRFRQLFEVELATGETRMLTNGPGVHADGCFAPAGRYVVAEARMEGERPVSRLWLIGPGLGGPVSLTAGPADYGPACAPDGSAIAWASSDHRDADRLFSQSPVQGGTPRDLGPGRSPAFSPDSGWIVYTARVKGRWSLYRIRPDGSGRRPIGQGTLDELDPSFSPDGKLVVYVGDDGFQKQLFLRRFDGSGDRLLLGSGGGTDPIW
jgi:TolB protein